MTEFVADIINTPVWVWLLLALLVWRGLKATTPREVRLRGLVIMPIILAGLSLHNLVGLVGANGTLIACALGAALGIAAGLGLERRHPAVPLGNGRLLLPGEWTQMVVVLSIFATRYVGTVLRITHPDIAADGRVILVLAGVSVFFSALMLIRTAARLWFVHSSGTRLAA